MLAVIGNHHIYSFTRKTAITNILSSIIEVEIIQHYLQDSETRIVRRMQYLLFV